MLRRICTARGGWFSRQDAMAAGYSPSELQLRVRQGRWLRLSRDVYVEAADWPSDEIPWDRARRRHLVEIRAVVARLGPDVVVSHQSAAVLHGLPLWGLDLSRVHVTRPSRRTRSERTVVVHRSALDDGETTLTDGIRVTTVSRSVAETAAASSYEIGVVLADAALHQGLVSTDELVTTADRFPQWAGSPAARAAARFADALSESVGESRTRVLIANAGMPKPRLQVVIRERNGVFVARVDILVGEELVVEFDGEHKYGGSADAVLAEKWREDRIRARGYRVARVGWSDLDQPTRTANRLWSALNDGRRQVTGA
ncbi:type IV toxin-antitoxin system AbiEi family antitoxin domain-containing protein [Kribbella yunnanensis]